MFVTYCLGGTPAAALRRPALCTSLLSETATGSCSLNDLPRLSAGRLWTDLHGGRQEVHDEGDGCGSDKSQPHGQEFWRARVSVPARTPGRGLPESGPGGPQPVQPLMVPGGSQLSGLLPVTDVAARVTVPPELKMPPPWAAVLPVTWL